MPLEGLRRDAPTDDEIYIEPDYDLPDEPALLMPTIFPTDINYCITVFYDPVVIANDAAFHELNDRMLRTYAGREIRMSELNKASIEYKRLSKFPENEFRFLRRGYVADVEGRIFGPGGTAQSHYARRNIAALNVNIMLMEALLRKQPIRGINRRLDAAANWRHVWKTMGPVTGKETQHRDEREGILIARLEDDINAEFDVAQKEYPLVEHEGLLLGCTNFSTPRIIHWAYDITPMSAWFEGGNDKVCDNLFGRKATEIRKQINFEATNARVLFRPELMKIGATRSEVTPLMIATWYSQAIASIRKICWVVKTEEDSSVAAHDLYQEEARHGFVLGTEERLPIKSRSWDQLMIEKSEDLRAVMARHTPQVAAGQTTIPDISSHDEVLGSLMGTTYDSHDDPDESPYSDRNIFTRSLAHWIGRLKRKGSESIDHWTADSILSFWHQSRYEALLLSQFPETTWECLVQVAERFEQDYDAPEVQVTYEWTRDRTGPYKCRVRNNVIEIEGPLLAFPTLQSDHWREKAEVVDHLEGFEVR